MIVYRAVGEGPIRSYAHSPLSDNNLERTGNRFQFFDQEVLEDQSYDYQILIRHEDDTSSQLSERIRLPKQ